MFDTFKLYLNKAVPQATVQDKLVALGYRRVDATLEEGDFSCRGDTLELYPVNFNFPLRIEWEFDCIRSIYSFDTVVNRKIIDYDFLLVIPHHKKSRVHHHEDLPLDAILRIKPGDYIVHSRYGIGRYVGTKKMLVRGVEGYYFDIEYDRGDRLYVSKEEAHFVQKYNNLTGKPPQLSRLGSKEWTRIKERVEKGIKEFALELLRMQAQRALIGGFRYEPDTAWQLQFEAGFPYEETHDQRKAIEDVKRDMESGVCMDRIICGDVGYGKTEVAMRAAFKAAVNGKQTAFLVPTTILAYQHYTNLSKRLADFPVSVDMLSRFRSPAQQRDIVHRVRAGKIDIIIGTHRLFSSDIEFKNLGLLIIDEEHKFGVEHKEILKKIKVGVDILTLTATPIPRTLYMGLIGIKHISAIKTPPAQRLAVKTKVVEYSSTLLRDVIVREVERGGEVFIVHNRVESIYQMYAVLKKILPKSITTRVVHGQMPAREIEAAMLDFVERRIQCLLSTAIVESGIDIPSANTIIINNAHQIGFADLHQLRGRVGRFNVQAYAYLMVPRLKEVSSDAAHRLTLIEEYAHLGAGFDIAMSDLELRGAGNLLGKEQHGYVWMVGFDLYCRLLKKEVEYLKDAFKIDIK